MKALIREQDFFSYCKQGSYVLLMIVIEGCNQSPIITLYISMRKSSCTVGSDDTGGGVAVYVYEETQMILEEQNYRVISNHPNKPSTRFMSSPARVLNGKVFSCLPYFLQWVVGIGIISLLMLLKQMTGPCSNRIFCAGKIELRLQILFNYLSEPFLFL